MNLDRINKKSHTKAHPNPVAENQLLREILGEAGGKKDHII